MNDTFFGELERLDGVGSSVKLPLDRVSDLAVRVTPEFFTNQLNRLLVKSDGHVVLEGKQGIASLDPLVRQLAVEQVGLVELHWWQRQLGKPDEGLCCDIVLPQGVVTVQGCWNVSSANGVKMVAATLLRPLLLTGFDRKGYIRWCGQPVEPLIQGYVRDPLAMMERLCRLGGSERLWQDSALRQECANVLNAAEQQVVAPLVT